MLTPARQAGLLDIGWQLAGITDEEELTRASTQLVRDWTGADAVGFSRVQHRSREITGVELSISPVPSQEAALLRTRFRDALATDHPIAAHFARRPHPVPVRLSDLVPLERFLDTATYATLFGPRGIRHQIALPIRLTRDCSRSYGVNRGDVDFSDEELRQSHALQATLSAVHAAAAAHRPVEADPRVRLTAREREVLALIASGMTAAAVGRACRISPRTVHKHLENAYAELGAHDRVTALDRARRLGLLPWPGRSAGPA